MSPPPSPSDAELARAVAALRAGRLVAFPTETVYGLGADAENEAAVRGIYEAKGRPPGHPLIVHFADPAALDTWAARVSPDARRLAERFWPGPLTMILERHPRVPLAVTGGLSTVGLRVPRHPVALALLRAFGGGVAAPSANRFGSVSPTLAEHVRQDLGERVDLVLDGGPCDVGVESTIVDLSGDAPALLRPGGVTREALEEALGRPVPLREGGPVRAPGLLPSHYAPSAEVRLVAPDHLVAEAQNLRGQGHIVGVIARPDVVIPDDIETIRVPGDLAEMAQQLYLALREADRLGWRIVLAALPPEIGLGLAVADRLRRAAGPRSTDGHSGPT